MRLHKATIGSVRNLKSLTLDFRLGLTVVTGPNGSGKTTAQKSILGALFHCRKELREALVSRYDPDTAPTVTVQLSRNEGQPIITLVRRLTDDSGEWREGPTVVKQKGKALEKVQAELPISEAAAAILLWGNQEDMTSVLETFPADGHSLLTAATIKGAGPDPKGFIQQLDDEFKAAKRGGKNPGPLTAAELRLAALQDERERAGAAQQKQTELLATYQKAKVAHDQAKRNHEATSANVKTLAGQTKALQNCIHATAKLTGLQQRKAKWESLATEINQSLRSVQGLRDELAVLQAQYRVSRNRELTSRIAEIKAQLVEVEKADGVRSGIEDDLRTKQRPGCDDVALFRRLQESMKEAADKMEASGVRYQLDVDADSGAKTLRVSEDNGPFRQVVVDPGQPCEGVIGSLVVVTDGLRITATGKEDIASHKRRVQRTGTEIAALWKRFGVRSEPEFLALAAEKEQLAANLKDARNSVEKALKGETLANVKARLAKLEVQQKESPATDDDERAWGDKPLATPSEIERRLLVKQTDIEHAVAACRSLEQGKPTDEQQKQMEIDLRDAQDLARNADQDFRAADVVGREPTAELLEELKSELEESRDQIGEVQEELRAMEAEVVRLDTELKFAGPRRTLSVIDAEIEEAKQTLQLQQVQQEARQLLNERLQEHITEMAADVPRELADKITEHLVRLTGGAFKDVRLAEDLSIAGLTSGISHLAAWQPRQLSYGERHQLALAVKIAVARALAEINGPVFLILDDSLVSFDPDRRAQTEALLLDLVADGRLQVILFTCHADWVADWKRRAAGGFVHIELDRTAEYYVSPTSN